MIIESTFTKKKGIISIATIEIKDVLSKSINTIAIDSVNKLFFKNIYQYIYMYYYDKKRSKQ